MTHRLAAVLAHLTRCSCCVLSCSVTGGKRVRPAAVHAPAAPEDAASKRQEQIAVSVQACGHDFVAHVCSPFAPSSCSASFTAVNPLILQQKTVGEKPPELYPDNVELREPKPLTAPDRVSECGAVASSPTSVAVTVLTMLHIACFHYAFLQQELVERARFLGEYFHYSGYYVTKRVKFNADYERYSDRYRKIEGRKNFYDEIAKPSPLLFPRELLDMEYRPSKFAMFIVWIFAIVALID